jgi:hypothetical protein
MNASQLVRATSPMFSFTPPPIIDANQNLTQGWVSENCSSPSTEIQLPTFCNFPGFTTNGSGPFYYTSAPAPTVSIGPYRGGSHLLTTV